MIYMAVLAPVIFGFAGLSVDIGYWYANARMAQNAADSAAIAASLEVLRSNGDSDLVNAAAVTQASNSGFSTSSGDSVVVNYPPASGPNAGSPDFVEVVITRPAQTFFAQVLYQGQTNITARAVAKAASTDTCVWALNPSTAGAVTVSGAAEVELSCGVYVNSTNGNALRQMGSGCLTASKINVVGGYSVNCASPEPISGVIAAVDPLAALPPPATGSCDYNGNVTVSGGQNRTLTPGTYCGNIQINGNATVTFDAGLYVMNGGGLRISGQATVSGVEVSFYLTENSGTSDSITINGGAVVSFSAASDGPLPGILFYQNRNAPSNVTHRFNGGAEMNLDGTLYFPNQDLQFAGGSDLQNSAAVIIADTVKFTGNTEVDIDTTVGDANPLLSEATLVE